MNMVMCKLVLFQITIILFRGTVSLCEARVS